MARMVRIAVPVAVLLGLINISSCFVMPSGSFVVVPESRITALRASTCRNRPRTPRALRLSATAEAPEASAVAAPEPVMPAAVATPEADEAPKMPLSDIVVGNEYEGEVNNVVSYGAFVDVGAEVNGLVHISQLADEFVSDPADVVKIGDKVKVRAVMVNKDAKRLVLSMRNNPRPAREQSGDVAKYAAILAEDPARMLPGVVESMVAFGCFVKLEDGTSGFVHISQIKPPSQRVEKVADVLSVGDAVEVRIREVDLELKRLNLSLVPLSELTGAAAAERVKDVSGVAALDRNEFRTGTVSAIMNYGLFVNIEGVDGLLHISKIRDDNSVTAEELQEKYKLGQEVSVRVLDVDTNANKMSLTMLPPVDAPDYERFADVPAEEWLEGQVVSITEYGAFVHLGHGVDGMVHISQLGSERVNAVTDAVTVGDTVRVRIVEVNVPQKRVRLTMREDGGRRSQGGKNTRRPKNVAKYLDVSPDEWIEGTVQSLTDFGAFVAVDEETDGLLHISQISDEHVDNVADVLSVGQTVQVRVLEVDADSNRLGLTMRAPRAPREGRGGGGGGGQRRGKKDVSRFVNADPKEFITGTVASILPYGAFVNIGEGIDGLVHISQIAEGRVSSVEDVLRVGDEVQVRVVVADADSGTVNLSMLEPREGGGGGDFDDWNDESGGGGGGRKREKKARFDNLDYDTGSSGSGAAADGDWQKYLNDFNADRSFHNVAVMKAARKKDVASNGSAG